MNRVEFCAVWHKWDDVMAAMQRHPTAHYGKMATERLVEADRRLADNLGTQHHRLRAQLAALRRDGLSYEQAFDVVAT